MKFWKGILARALALTLLLEGLSGLAFSARLFVYAEETVANVALNKPVEVSEVDSQTPDMTGDKAVDGVIGNQDSDTSRWSGGVLKAGISGNADQWLIIDLKAQKTSVQSISVYFYKLVWSRDYKIQTRGSQSEEWTDVYRVNSSDRAGSAQNPTDVISGSDAGELKRYVRFLFLEGSLNPSAGGHRISIREIEINGAQTGEDPVSSAQEALAKLPSELTVLGEEGSFQIPEVSEDYQIEVYGSEADRILADDGSLSPYRLSDRSMNVILKAVNRSDPSDTAKRNITVTTQNNRSEYPVLFPQVSSPNPMPEILPAIQEWYGYQGSFELTEDTKIVVNDRAAVGLRFVAEEMQKDLEEICGVNLKITEGVKGGAGNIYLESLEDDVYGVGEEGYFLVNGNEGIQIFSSAKTGVLYGTVTVEQILFQDADHAFVPKGVIRDYPLYSVRGMMFDVARIPTRMQFLEDYTRIMKWYKMNDMQIHLNDTQWSEPDRNSGEPEVYDKVEASHRLESELFPSLATQEAKFEVAAGQWNNKYGGDYAGRYDYYYESHTGAGGELYYTKDEYRSLEDLAKERGIRLVSELDTPGHATPYNKYVYNHQEEVIRSLADHGYLNESDYLNADGTVKKNFYTHNPNNFEVFSIDDENSNAQVRQNAIHAKIFIKALFDEYLGGIDGIEPLFTVDTVHAGVDEYFDRNEYNKQAFRRYMNEMYDFLGTGSEDAYGKEVRMWGGLKLMGGSEGVNRDIVLSMWNCREEEDLNARLNDGFSLINVPQQYFYTTPGRYHKDMIREDDLYYNWTPEKFDGGGCVDKGEPLLKGASGALWGDANRSGTTEADLNERYLRAIAMMSEKTWGGIDEDDTFLSYERKFDRLREGPGTKIANKIESKTNLVLEYDFSNLSEDGKTIYDASGNAYHGAVTGGEIAEKEKETMLKFDGQTKIQTPLTSLSYPYTVSFDLYLDGEEENGKDAALFSGYDGRLQVKGLSDNLGLNRSHFTQSFGYAAKSGKKHRISVVGTYQTTKLYVDGRFQKILYAKGRDKDNGGELNNEKWTDKDDNFSATFVFPLNVIGENFSGYLGNIKAYNKALSVEEFDAEGSKGEAGVDVARNRGAYADNGNPAFWGDTMRLFPAWKATDGDGHVTGETGNISASYESRWYSSDRDDDFLMVDLGIERNISKVVIDWEKDRYASAYKLMASQDGKNWREVKSVTGNANAITSDTLSETKARYVKMQGVARSGKSNVNEYAIYEIKVYENVDKTALGDQCRDAEALFEESRIGWETEGEKASLWQRFVLAKAVLSDVMAGREEVDAAVLFLQDLIENWEGGSEPSPDNQVTVTFESNGGTNVQSQKIEKGETAKKPQDPEKQGYEFGGWHLDDGEFKREYDFASPVTEDVTLYAKWIEEGVEPSPDNSVTVTFKSNGGTNVQSQKIEKGEMAKEPKNPVRTGHIFEGWYKDNGTFKVKHTFNSEVNEDIVLYAKWKLAEYTITFISDGKIWNTQKVSYGKKATEPRKPAKKGYIFGDWHENVACTKKYNYPAVTGNKKLYAKWTKTVSQTKKVTGIAFASKKYQIAKGKKIDLNKQVSVWPEDAADKTLTWVSMNPKYASVENGVVKTKKAGVGKKVEIVAKAADGSGIQASVTVQIMKHAVKKITLSAPKAIKAGKKAKIKANIKTTGKKVNKKLLWTSSNPDYALVNQKGMVKALKAGKNKTVKITASSTDGANKKKTIKIRIK